MGKENLFDNQYVASWVGDHFLYSYKWPFYLVQEGNCNENLEAGNSLGIEGYKLFVMRTIIFLELRQRNILPKGESPEAPLQRTISEPSLAESPGQINQSEDRKNSNQTPVEPRKSSSLMNIPSNSSG